MAVVRFYSDDSGDDADPQHAIVSVAANVCTDQGWGQFEADWNAVLAKHQVPYLHMKEWSNRDCVHYKHLRAPESAESFFGDLVDVMKRNLRHSLGASIRLQDLRRFNKDFGLSLEPYALALYLVVIEIRKIEPVAKVELIIDRLDKPYRKIETAEAYIESDKRELRNITINSLGKDESFRKVLPMQAADFFAWEMRKSCEERKGFTPSDLAQGDFDTWSSEHEAWENDFIAVNNRKPRLRRSAFRLMTEIKNSGEVFDYRKLVELHKMHPNGWAA